MANPQPEDPHLRIAHSIEEQIMVRDFTEHELKILLFILRLSWGCHKHSAYIPRQKDFELIGVREVHIKARLDYLISSRVIFRDADRYEFNKDFDKWNISRNRIYTPEKLTELVSLNVNGNDEKLTENVSQNLHKRKVGTYIKGKFGVSLPPIPPIPPVPTLKEKLKESLKKAADGLLTKKYLEEVFSKGPAVMSGLQGAFEKYPEDWLNSAFRQGAERNAHSFKYVLSILERYEQQGGPDADSGDQGRHQIARIDPDKYIHGKYGHMVQR